MFRLILIILLFIASLVNIFPVPAKEVWYTGIAVSEFPWIFIAVSLLLLFWTIKKNRFKIISLLLSIATLIILCLPVFGAYKIGRTMQQDLTKAFGPVQKTAPLFPAEPYSFFGMFKGTGAKEIGFKTYEFSNPGIPLTLNFSRAASAGVRPCILEIHGGSWKRGDNSELAHFNNYMANAGYHVATMNYRLAPKYTSPAQEEDIRAALKWLKAHAAELKIDTNKFVITGRSAGGHLALSAAYKNIEPGIAAVAAFYGPVDMFWTYDHPDNPLIMDSREVQRDFLGGTPQSAKDRYQAESPLFYANARSVPTLIVHGANDAHVFHEQSVRMTAKLNELGVPNYFLSLPWATHGCEYNLSGPSGQLSLYAMQHLMESIDKE